MDLPAGRMHYVDEGRGETLLFVHGTPTWSFEWRHLIRALSPTHRCVAPDHFGFGLSERPANASYTPEAHAERFAAFVEGLNPEPFTLVVHDYGGPIALPVCLREPHRVRRLVLINTWMWSFAGDRDMETKARIAGGRLGRFLYRRANFSLRFQRSSRASSSAGSSCCPPRGWRGSKAPATGRTKRSPSA